MPQERNLVIYAVDPNEIAEYLKGFGLDLQPEGSDPIHWCVERGQDTIHVCQERRQDILRVPEEPGVHGVWHYIKHQQISDQRRDQG